MTLQRKTPLKRTGGPKRTGRVKPVSDKRRSNFDRRAEVVAQVTLRDKTCRAVGLVDHRCSPTLDVHEVIPRSAWADGWLVADNCILVCRTAHDWIGDHPNSAHLLGLHGYSWERPDTAAL